MSEKSERLRETIHQLHDQLSAVDPVDAEVRELLAEALGDIQAALKQSAAGVQATDDQGDESSSLVGRITAAARHFEVSHPTLSDTLRKIADLLAQIGI